MTPPAAKPAQPMAVSPDVGAEYVMGKLSKRESGPWEVLLEPWDTGRLPTSDALEAAIRTRAAGLIPPTVVRGLSVELRGFRVEGPLFLVWGFL